MAFNNFLMVMLIGTLFVAVFVFYDKIANYLHLLKSKLSKEQEALHHAEMTISKLDYHLQFSCTGDTSQEALQGIAGLMQLASESDKVAK